MSLLSYASSSGGGVLAAEDNVGPGLLGFLVVVSLGVALFFLIRSMNKQISRIEAPRAEDLKQEAWERRQAQENKSNGEAGGDGQPGGSA